MSEEKKEVFIGPRKVEQVVTDEDKTFGGNPIVTVHYAGGHKESMPESAFELLKTEKPTDFTTLTDKKVNKITLQVMEILAEHHIYGYEIDAIANSIANEFQNSFNKANHILWEGDDKSYTPGSNTLLEKTFLAQHRIIKSIADGKDEK